ncbi:MAG: ribonuclease HI family protein [Candidatus Omnitrophica bacterium]|nr:ribonuclease HI family protein [Candidatus Omnitrophota bacterium]
MSEGLYQVYIDGASIGNPGPSGAGAVLKDARGETLSERSDYIGMATNNVAEYRALILGLLEAVQFGVKHLEVLTDSELVAQQVNGQYKVKDEDLKQFYGIYRNIAPLFTKLSVRHIPRGLNKAADKLAQQAAEQKSSSS